MVLFRVYIRCPCSAFVPYMQSPHDFSFCGIVQVHRGLQVLAPHVTENPIFFHATNVTDAGFRHAIDQMAEVGFEMLIFSFGSGFRLETADPAYLRYSISCVGYFIECKTI